LSSWELAAWSAWSCGHCIGWAGALLALAAAAEAVAPTKARTGWDELRESAVEVDQVEGAEPHVEAEGPGLVGRLSPG
jgi:hypothetical protein